MHRAEAQHARIQGQRRTALAGAPVDHDGMGVLRARVHERAGERKGLFFLDASRVEDEA